MTTEGVMTMETKGKKKWWSAMAGLIAGAAFGAGLGYTLGHFMKTSHKASEVPASDVVALTLTVFYLSVALLLLWIASDRMRLARTLEGKSADVPASDAEFRSFCYQAQVMGFAAILLALPVFGARLSHGGMVYGRFFYAGIVVLFAVQTFYNVRLWQISDEFLRNTMAATAGWTFAIGQAGLFLWAAAERMSLVKPVTAWDLTVAMMLLYLFVGSVVSVRSAARVGGF